MRHTRYGYWLEEAGPVEPTRPLEGDTTADVVVVGAGYLGLWTAWQLKALEPELDVVVLDARARGARAERAERRLRLDALGRPPDPARQRRRRHVRSRCAVPPSGQSTGSGRSAPSRGSTRCYRAGGTIQVATSDGAARGLGRARRGVRGGRRSRRGAAAVARTRSPSAARRRLFLGGLLLPTAANVQPARLALGLRAKVIEAGVRLHERTRGQKLSADAERVDARAERCAPSAAVLAVNSATAGFRGLSGTRSAVASSHMVITEPVPDVIEEIGWTGGENIARLPHAAPLPPHDERRADRARLGRRPDGLRRPPPRPARHRPRRRSRTRPLRSARLFPQLAGREVTHAWGGPIDVSPTHLPIFGSRGRVHHGFGFTGNGVGPTYLGGEILARLALDRRDELTRLAIVDPDAQADAARAAALGGGTHDPRGARPSRRRPRPRRRRPIR